MGSNFSAPYPSQFRSGPMSWSAPLSLDGIQKSIGPGVLNASRVQIDQFRLMGAKDGDAVSVIGQRHLPQTGVQWLDSQIDTTASTLDYIPQATQDAFVTALKSGLTGGAIVSGLTAGVLGLLKLAKIDEKASGKLKVAIVLGYGGVVGAATAVGGFFWSLCQNLIDAHRHLAKNPPEQKQKRGL